LRLHPPVRRPAEAAGQLRPPRTGGAGLPLQRLRRQEPGTLEEIQSFCSTTYGANFELFDKVHATGSKTEPYLTLTQAEPAGDVAWNFEKFLVGRDGIVFGRFKSGVDPEAPELIAAIEAALTA